jgi:hypothetical protein
LLELELLVKRMKKWDRSSLDVSNWLGGCIFIILTIILGFTMLIALVSFDSVTMILVADAAALILPHWITGLRSIMTQPALLIKSGIIQSLVKTNQTRLKEHQVELFMLLKGVETKIPDDMKIRVKLQNQHPDFLGFYGQIVLNHIQGKPFPYFYVVLVAKQDFGLNDAFNRYQPPSSITKEFKREGDVEVLVIRQTTTSTSGYHTKDRDIQRIFLEGLVLAEEVAPKK